MNKNQIKIGKRYINTSKEVKGVVFIGVGEMRNRKPHNQQMVVVRTSKIVAGPKSHQIKDFWKKFKEI